MAINESIEYNGGLLHVTTLIGEPFDTMKSFCPYSRCSHLDNFPPEGGCSEGLDAFRFFRLYPLVVFPLVFLYLEMAYVAFSVYNVWSHIYFEVDYRL